jgi:hypothetical protein
VLFEIPYYSDTITQKLVQKSVEEEGNLGRRKVQGELVMAAYVHPCGEEEVLHMALGLPRPTSICYHSTPEFMA